MQGRGVFLAILLVMLAASIPTPASADVTGAKSRGFTFVTSDGTVIAQGRCSWSWSKAPNGTYTDLYGCRVTDRSGPAKGVSVRLFYKPGGSPDWIALSFSHVNGANVGPIAKCAVNGLDVSKSCSRKRTTQQADLDFRISACVTAAGACTSHVYVSVMFGR